MRWETQGRKEHGWFGDGRADTTKQPQPSGPAAPLIQVKYQPRPQQGSRPPQQPGSRPQPHPPAAASTQHDGGAALNVHDQNVEDLARVF